MSDGVVVLMIQNRGMPGTGISEIEKNQITSDLTTLLGRPVIAEMADLSDVDIAGIADGDVLQWNDADSEWQVSPMLDGRLARVEVAGGGGDGYDNIATLGISSGLQISSGASGSYASIAVLFGTTASTVAAGNHAHNNPLPVFQSFSATGYMSGGSRQVVSRSVTLLNGVSYVVKARFRPQLRGADAGAAYYTLTTSIGGNARTSPGGASNGFWCVQGVPNKEEWAHARTIVGTGAAVTVTGSVAYHSGAGFNVDAGELEIELKPSR